MKMGERNTNRHKVSLQKCYGHNIDVSGVINRLNELNEEKYNKHLPKKELEYEAHGGRKKENLIARI